jgi:myo-inositol-1(or 4)-monophosphatase
MPDEPAGTAESVPADPLDADWFALCRRTVAAHRELFAEDRTIAGRTVYDGRGEGGDHTLVIDRRAEDAAFAELAALHARGYEFTAVSEERGTIRFGQGDSPAAVVIDPIDGSLNARRTLPSHAFSLAVASGPTMRAVEVAYVYDFGAGEEFTARRGHGATLNGIPLRSEGPDYGLEVVGIEGAKPERLVPMLEELEGTAFRVRAIGSLALMLCYVAAGRLDGALTARACRSVDVAAAQLIAREAGAALEFPGFDDGSASLDLDARYHVTAALDDEMLAALRPAQDRAEPVREGR